MNAIMIIMLVYHLTSVCLPFFSFFGWSGGRLCTRFLGSQVHADGSGPGSQVHADGSGQGRKGNGLVCTRGMVLLYVHLCSYSCVFCALHVCRLSGTGL